MSEKNRLLNIAIKKLTYRGHSVGEIENYLRRKLREGEGEAEISDAITTLIVMGLLDDEKFAADWIRSRVNKGKGQIIIKYELRQKKVDSSIIEEKLTNIDESLLIEAAVIMLNKKRSKFSKLNGYQQNQKMKQYLYQRGFEMKTINSAIEQYQQN